MTLGIALPFILLDTPDKAKFMTAGEKDFYVRRLQRNYNQGGKDDESFKWKYF